MKKYFQWFTEGTFQQYPVAQSAVNVYAALLRVLEWNIEAFLLWEGAFSLLKRNLKQVLECEVIYPQGGGRPFLQCNEGNYYSNRSHADTKFYWFSLTFETLEQNNKTCQSLSKEDISFSVKTTTFKPDQTLLQGIVCRKRWINVSPSFPILRLQKTCSCTSSSCLFQQI